MFANQFVGKGVFWLKASHTANNLTYTGRRYYSFEVLMKEIERCVTHDVKAVFPYLMLQPAIPNNTEYKVILLDGVPKYFFAEGQGATASPTLGSDQGKKMFAFATLVHQTWSSRNPQGILDGLGRVDIMELEDGELVVNEIEGVDSNYSSKSFGKQCQTVTFLDNYWTKIIANCVKKFVEEKRSNVA